MRYVKARLAQEQREWAYRNYIADTLYFRNQNPPQMLVHRLSEILYPERRPKMETEEEIYEKLRKGGILVESADTDGEARNG